MAKMHISTSINGEATEFLCEPHETLLDVLRNDLQLTGTKEGCGSGDCGACSVTVDGRLTCACLVLGVEAQGREIGTIEGVGSSDKLSVIQEKFLEHAALQCGICTPGLIVSTQELLRQNPDPTEEQARYFLAGNLCRCTGYDKIIRAVLDSAATLRAEQQGVA
jgi:carbon-monoxide dehydrogenase small subunit